MCLLGIDEVLLVKLNILRVESVEYRWMQRIRRLRHQGSFHGQATMLVILKNEHVVGRDPDSVLLCSVPAATEPGSCSKIGRHARSHDLWALRSEAPGGRRVKVVARGCRWKRNMPPRAYKHDKSKNARPSLPLLRCWVYLLCGSSSMIALHRPSRSRSVNLPKQPFPDLHAKNGGKTLFREDCERAYHKSHF
jgi:hypothetical protein